jgi:hypothetical protein
MALIHGKEPRATAANRNFSAACIKELNSGLPGFSAIREQDSSVNRLKTAIILIFPSD